MIEELEIRGVGGIIEASLSFGGDFIVITGESGAGKSSLVRAMEFISGRRAQAGDIHTHEENCEVRAVMTSAPIEGISEKYQPQEQTLIAKRSFSRGGRGRAALQEQTVPLAVLARAMESNVVIQSQFAQLGLLEPQKQLELVDSCGGDNLKALSSELEKVFSDAIAAEKEIVALKKRRGESEKKFDGAPAVIRQLRTLELTPESEKEWELELSRIENAERERRLMSAAAEGMNDPENGILERLEKMARALRGRAESDDVRWEEAIEKALAGAQELSALISETRRAGGSEEDTEEAKERVEKKLGALRRIKRTLNIQSSSELIEYAKEAEAEIEWLKRSREELEGLEKKAQSLRRETSRLAMELRALRTSSAAELSRRVNEHLRGLAMEYALFSIEIEPLDRVRADGAENVHFMLALPEQTPLPVGKNASGGELSRILIALQLSVGDEKLPGTLIFDEVEAGLGGKTALLAGYKLRSLSKRCRTILITHQATIAAMADQHFVVKRSGEETEIFEVADEAREREIARMLSGDETSREALEHAKALLENNGEEPLV
ncbi:DNA repair protein RecN [Synergistes jonesii]|uniref:DNA repair protein RecN n=1 Tax=Synergistes jonesii TaxID=2754 RepID=UPI003329B8AE